MATMRVPSVEEADLIPAVRAVLDDIRATRNSAFINNFWLALANNPQTLARIWNDVKQIMVAPGALDPLTREMIYIAVSTVNNCAYCLHSHTAAAKAKGMTDAQHTELMSIIGLASQTNALANGMQIPVDAAFRVENL